MDLFQSLAFVDRALSQENLYPDEVEQLTEARNWLVDRIGEQEEQARLNWMQQLQDRFFSGPLLGEQSGVTGYPGHYPAERMFPIVPDWSFLPEAGFAGRAIIPNPYIEPMPQIGGAVPPRSWPI